MLRAPLWRWFVLVSTEVRGPAGLGMCARHEATVTAWQRLASQWRTTSQQHRASNAKFKPLIDLSQPDLPNGFVIDGDGLPHITAL